MDILWWIKWVSIIGAGWTVVAIIVAVTFGQIVRWSKKRERNWRRFPHK